MGKKGKKGETATVKKDIKNRKTKERRGGNKEERKQKAKISECNAKRTISFFLEVTGVYWGTGVCLEDRCVMLGTGVCG